MTPTPPNTPSAGLGLALAIGPEDAAAALLLLRQQEPDGSQAATSMLLQLTGSAAQVDVPVICLGHQAGELGAHHGLVSELLAALVKHAPERIAGPSLESGDADATAACAALRAAVLAWVGPTAQLAAGMAPPLRPAGLPSATAVICTWNKVDDVCANLDGLRAQTLPFDDIVVVDNASHDETADRLRADYPEVRLVVMPNSDYGACETFNIGFASARTDLIAILDDDVVLPPHWLERATQRLGEEPATTAVLSTQVVEPGMPESYLQSPAMQSERYMSTFRGCASLARTQAVREVGGYDERLFIYGNERDMTCRLLNKGYRVLQYPGVSAFHNNPFGISMGKRSLYYHARNAFLGMLKYAPLGDLVKMPFLVVTKVLLRSEAKELDGSVSDATGTLGLGRCLRETKGAWWVLVRAGWSVLCNIPYCLRHREPVKSSDFELPVQ